MSIQLSPETERMVAEEIARGRFQSVDEIIQQGIRARDSESEAERWRKHREAIARTVDFTGKNPLVLEGISFRELIEEGRRL
ncbi:MAG TPA: hypothetical protein VG225_00050 [Terracidiphilus sp.]|nr:hypothetical protein [Terracidiphilus sp.]